MPLVSASEQQQTIEVSDCSELIDSITNGYDFNGVEIRFTQNIDCEGFNFVDRYFQFEHSILDGDGFVLSNLNGPLFYLMNYSFVKNLTITDTNVSSN